MNECRRSAKEVQKDIGARFKFYKPMRKSVRMSSLYDLQGTVKNEFLGWCRNNRAERTD